MHEMIVLVIGNQQLCLAFDCKPEGIFEYLHKCMTNNELCLVRDSVGNIKAMFRGSKIDGVYINKVDQTASTVLSLQMENLRLQNNQLKTIASGDSWKSQDLD
jgi:hypothetical protein